MRVALAAAQIIRLNSKSLEECHEKVTQRPVAITRNCHVLTVLETTARRHDSNSSLRRPDTLQGLAQEDGYGYRLPKPRRILVDGEAHAGPLRYPVNH